MTSVTLFDFTDKKEIPLPLFRWVEKIEDRFGRFTMVQTSKVGGRGWSRQVYQVKNKKGHLGTIIIRSN